MANSCFKSARAECWETSTFRSSRRTLQQWRVLTLQFYDIAFRKKIYSSVEELQIEVDLWVNKYNTEKVHSGKHCYGKTPMQTFSDAKYVSIEKTIPSNLAECQIADTHDLSDRINP